MEGLINRGIKLTGINTDGDTALHVAVAARVGNVEIATELLRVGSDVNAKGHGGATPLHHTARTANTRMVQVLLGWEAKPGVRDGEGETAPDQAKDPEMMQHELKRKGSDNENLTALHRAEEDGDSEVVQVLLDLGVDVDERNLNRQTRSAPLNVGSDPKVVGLIPSLAPILAESCQFLPSLANYQSAPKMGYQEFVEQLIDRGAVIAATGHYAETSLHLAAKSGLQEVVEALLVAGAQIGGMGF